MSKNPPQNNPEKNPDNKSDDNKPTIQLDSGGSFYKLILYGVIGAFAIFVIYINVSAWNIPDEDEESKGDGDSVAVEVVEDKDINDPDRMMKLLFGMKEQVKVTPREGIEELQNARIEAAEKLLEIASTDDHTAFAAKTCFEALVKLNSLGDETARERLVKYVEQFKDSEVGDVALSGQYALLSVDFGNAIQDKDSDFQPVLNQIEVMLSDNLEDAEFAIMLRTILEQLIKDNRKSDSNALMRLMLGYYNKSSSAGAKDITSFLEGMLVMEEVGLGEITVDLLKGTEGSVEKFKVSMQNLIDRKAVNLFVFEQIVQVPRTLTKYKFFDKSREVNTFLRDAFENYYDADVANYAKEDFSGGLKRLEMLGKKINIRGRTLDGEAFDPETIKDRVVAVYFCTIESPASMQFLGQLVPLREEMYQRGFELVGYIVGEKPQDTVEAMGGNFPPFPIVVPEQADEAQKNYANTLGIQTAPYIVLANKDKIIQDIDVQPPTLASEIDMVLRTGKILTREEMLEKQAEFQKNEDAKAKNKKGNGANDDKQNDDKQNDDSDKAQTPEHAANEYRQESEIVELDLLELDVLELGVLELEVQCALPDDLIRFQDDDTEEQQSDRKKQDAQEENPYLAPAHWTTTELVEFILDMKDKPRSIMKRESFALAVADAADRVLANDGISKPHQRIAILGKTEVLHQHACYGNDTLDKVLAEYIKELKVPDDKLVKREIAFLQLEQEVILALAGDEGQIPKTLADSAEFFEANKNDLNNRHLRLASISIELVNRLTSDDESKEKELAVKRDEYFKSFGKLFATSKDKRLAKYGKYLAKTTGDASALVGKALELAGPTVDGGEFDWESYRGKVVVVDFWATWCGPCRAEMPNVKELYEELKSKGFEVVGVSLDDDVDDVSEYVRDENIPWQNIVGEDAKALAQKYGVKGIPTMMVVDHQGNVVAVANRIDKLKPAIDKSMATEK